MKLALRSACLLALLTACGPAPYLSEPAEDPSIATVVLEDQRMTVVVEPLETRGVSSSQEVASPLLGGQVWAGTYECPQGETELNLIVVDAAGERIRAIFDFVHGPSGAKGSFVMDGSFDPRTDSVTFAPKEWIVRPSNYVTVGMRGRVDLERGRFAGHITNPACGAFSLSLTPAASKAER